MYFKIASITGENKFEEQQNTLPVFKVKERYNKYRLFHTTQIACKAFEHIFPPTCKFFLFGKRSKT